VTATGLGRRLAALEEASMRRRATRLAAEYGLAIDELLGPFTRLAAEERRLRARGLSEAEIGRGLVRWIAADLGLDPDELEAEWERH
jgi:hypothetical protein